MVVAIVSFVPSLVQLQNIDTNLSFQCVWRRKKKNGCQTQCARRISPCNELRRVISELRETQTLVAKDLSILSEMLLCGRSHRQKKSSDLIFDFWAKQTEGGCRDLPRSCIPSTSTACNEIQNESRREKDLQLVSTRAKRKNKTAANQEIRILLKIDEGFLLTHHGKISLTCHGKTESGSKCKNVIAQKYYSEISKLIAEIALPPALSPDEVLRNLAHLVLCRGVRKLHQAQADAVASIWRSLLSGSPEPDHTLKPENVLVTKSHKTPNRTEKNASTLMTPTSDNNPASQASSGSSKFSLELTPDTSPEPEKGDKVLHGEHVAASCTDVASPTPRSRKGRGGYKLHTHDVPLPKSQKSKKELEKESKEKLKEECKLNTNYKLPYFSPSEKHKRTPKSAFQSVAKTMKRVIRPGKRSDGYVYIFQLKGTDLFKVGFSGEDYACKRMNDYKKCIGDIDEESFQYFRVQNPQRVEKLVHSYLNIELMFHDHVHIDQPSVIHHWCNTCKKRHNEILACDRDCILAAIQMWIEWMNRSPYEKGNKGLRLSWKLKEKWKKRVDELKFEEGKDPWPVWTTALIPGDETAAITSTVSETIFNAAVSLVDEKLPIRQKPEPVVIPEEVMCKLEEDIKDSPTVSVVEIVDTPVDGFEDLFSDKIPITPADFVAKMKTSVAAKSSARILIPTAYDERTFRYQFREGRRSW